MSQIKGSQIEMSRMKSHSINAVNIVWSESYQSHAFVLEQILSKLDSAGYASREEMVSEWKSILESINQSHT